MPALAASDIVIRRYGDLSKRERKTANTYFVHNVFPILTPQAVDPGHPFPYVSNLSLNLGVMVAPSQSRRSDQSGILAGARFARIKLPPLVELKARFDHSEGDKRFDAQLEFQGKGFNPA